MTSVNKTALKKFRKKGVNKLQMAFDTRKFCPVTVFEAEAEIDHVMA